MIPCFSVVAINKKYANPKVSCSVTRRYGNVFALSNANSGGVVDKDFEFKPSFDDYLKAMELAKSGKEKKHGKKLDRGAAKDDLDKKDEDSLGRKEIRESLDKIDVGRNEDTLLARKKIRGNLDKIDVRRDEDSLEKKKIRGELDEEVILNSVKHGGLQDGRSDYKKREVRRSSSELRDKESSMRSVEPRKRLGEREIRRSSHELHDKESSMRSVQPRNRLGERESRRSSHELHDKESSMRSVQPRDRLGEREIRRSSPELHDKESSMRSVQPRNRLGERTGERFSKYTHQVAERSNVYNTPRLGRARVSPVFINDVRDIKVTSVIRGKLGHPVFKETSSSVDEKRIRNYSKVEEDDEEEILPKYRKGRSYRNFVVEDEDNDMLADRAAFRISENLDEVVNKPKVPLREMEDRVQLLAKRYSFSPLTSFFGT
ncbi:hypothetical protein ACFE04_000516 [Oxalis oulophora]